MKPFAVSLFFNRRGVAGPTSDHEQIAHHSLDFTGRGDRYRGYFGWHHYRSGEQRRHGQTRRNGAQCRPRHHRARRKIENFPVYLTGLGIVQGFNTVVVRTRVDGQIDKIAFKEGQLVSQGDLFVEIDPRPYQATLDQAKAKKAQDEANLANANLDLQRYVKLGEFATKQQPTPSAPPFSS